MILCASLHNKHFKRNDNAKRARQNSPREEQQHGGKEDELYLELFDLIRTLQAKDETKEEQSKVLQTQLDQALAEIKSIKSLNQGKNYQPK